MPENNFHRDLHRLRDSEITLSNPPDPYTNEQYRAIGNALVYGGALEEYVFPTPIKADDLGPDWESYLDCVSYTDKNGTQFFIPENPLDYISFCASQFNGHCDYSRERESKEIKRLRKSIDRVDAEFPSIGSLLCSLREPLRDAIERLTAPPGRPKRLRPQRFLFSPGTYLQVCDTRIFRRSALGFDWRLRQIWRKGIDFMGPLSGRVCESAYKPAPVRRGA